MTPRNDVEDSSLDEDELAKRRRLAALRERKALEAANESWGGPSNVTCLGPGCTRQLRTARILRDADGKRVARRSWCSQECLDGYLAQFRLRGVSYEWTDADGTPKGFYIPKRGYVTLEEIDREATP